MSFMLNILFFLGYFLNATEIILYIWLEHLVILLHFIELIYNYMTKIEISHSWQVIQMYKMNSQDYFIFIDIH